MEPEQQLRNLRDFLLVYNRMTEICFQRCTSNLNYRHLTMDEVQCVDNCAGKLISSNHRIMATYVQLMPRMMQRRMDEMESKVAEAKAAEASSMTTTTDGPPASPPSVPDVGPDAAATGSDVMRNVQPSSDAVLSVAPAATDGLNPSSLTSSGPS